MRKIIVRNLILLFLFLFCNIKLVKAVATAGNSAIIDESLKVPETQNFFPDTRIIRLKNFLNIYHSPLVLYAELIVSTADKYNIPWSLVTSISGVESGFCHNLPYNSFNCWGWENGATRFRDYSFAIETVSRELKEHYWSRGLDTPEEIGKIYAPPSKTWAGKVRHFMYIIENQTLPNSLSLDITL